MYVVEVIDNGCQVWGTHCKPGRGESEAGHGLNILVWDLCGACSAAWGEQDFSEVEEGPLGQSCCVVHSWVGRASGGARDQGLYPAGHFLLIDERVF